MLNLQQVMNTVYTVPAGTLVHLPTRGAFGNVCFGQISNWNGDKGDFTVKGEELVESILLANRQIARIQQAVLNMQAVLDTHPAIPAQAPVDLELKTHEAPHALTTCV